MQALTDFLEQSGFDVTASLEIGGRFQRRELVKEEYFLREGQVNGYLGLIETGVLQAFYNHDGSELTTYIGGAGDFIVSLGSFLGQVPAREAIRALTPATIWTIHKTDLDALKNEHESFRSFYVGLLEHQLVCIDDSRFNLLTLNAEERYLRLLEEEPQLLQQIPLQYLASILGITPRHLSRIRKTIR